MILKHQIWLIAESNTEGHYGYYSVQGQCYKCLALVRAVVDTIDVHRALLHSHRPLEIKCETCRQPLEIHEAECRSEKLLKHARVSTRKDF